MPHWHEFWLFRLLFLVLCCCCCCFHLFASFFLWLLISSALVKILGQGWFWRHEAVSELQRQQLCFPLRPPRLRPSDAISAKFCSTLMLILIRVRVCVCTRLSISYKALYSLNAFNDSGHLAFHQAPIAPLCSCLTLQKLAQAATCDPPLTLTSPRWSQPSVVHPRAPRFVKKVIITFPIGRRWPYVQGRWDQAGERCSLLSCDYTLPGFPSPTQTKVSHQVMKRSPLALLFRLCFLVQTAEGCISSVSVWSWSGFCIAVWLKGTKEVRKTPERGSRYCAHSLHAKLFA